MQTYTHFLTGLLVGKLFFKDDDIVIAPIICAFGSVIPDIAAAGEYLKDKIQGRKPFINTGGKQFF